MIAIILPWPPKELNPNARIHWAIKSPITARARQAAALTARAANRGKAKGERVTGVIEFHPPDKRRRDKDNIQASCKAYQDGIADALGIDDNFFELASAMHDPIKGGKIIYKLEIS